MQLTLKIAKILVRLVNGETIPASSGKSILIDELVMENIILRKGKHRKSLQLLNEESLYNYLVNQLQINNLENYITALESKDSSRADFVKITSDSKNSKERAFKGFLVNCYHPIKAHLNNKHFTVNPLPGSFTFIYDYESFKIPLDVTIVGVENSRNFRHIEDQKHLFEDINPLFISRYPQNQDFIRWIKSIPNNYLHYGDFDIAGIGIYLNEYKNHLLERATFFIPKNIKKVLTENGNRERYNLQKPNFNTTELTELELIALVNLINKTKKGLDQEFFIL